MLALNNKGFRETLISLFLGCVLVYLIVTVIRSSVSPFGLIVATGVWRLGRCGKFYPQKKKGCLVHIAWFTSLNSVLKKKEVKNP
jgi:hypothetical protein